MLEDRLSKLALAKPQQTKRDVVFPFVIARTRRDLVAKGGNFLAFAQLDKSLQRNRPELFILEPNEISESSREVCPTLRTDLLTDSFERFHEGVTTIVVARVLVAEATNPLLCFVFSHHRTRVTKLKGISPL